MSLSQLNTFAPATRKGHVVQATATVWREARLDSGVSGAVEPSTPVKLAGYKDGIIVEPTAAIDDEFYGFVAYGTRNDEFVADGMVRLVKANAIMDIEVSAALTVGAKVEFNPASGKYQALTTGVEAGVLLQESTADGDIVKMEIK